MSFFRKSFSLFGLCLLTTPAVFAQEVPPSIVACTSQSNVLSRLECFDREVARLTRGEKPVASTQVPPAAPTVVPPVVAPTPPQNATPADDNFGLSGELARRRAAEEGRPQKKMTELKASIVKVTRKPYGEYVFELDNGQVWEQPEKKSSLFIKEGENIRITSGAMGSFFLTADSGATTRVRRVR
jgi:hypothetical protein